MSHDDEGVESTDILHDYLGTFGPQFGGMIGKD